MLHDLEKWLMERDSSGRTVKTQIFKARGEPRKS